MVPAQAPARYPASENPQCLSHASGSPGKRQIFFGGAQTCHLNAFCPPSWRSPPKSGSRAGIQVPGNDPWFRRSRTPDGFRFFVVMAFWASARIAFTDSARCSTGGRFMRIRAQAAILRGSSGVSIADKMESGTMNRRDNMNERVRIADCHLLSPGVKPEGTGKPDSCLREFLPCIRSLSYQ